MYVYIYILQKRDFIFLGLSGPLFAFFSQKKLEDSGVAFFKSPICLETQPLCLTENYHAFSCHESFIS